MWCDRERDVGQAKQLGHPPACPEGKQVRTESESTAQFELFRLLIKETPVGGTSALRARCCCWARHTLLSLKFVRLVCSEYITYIYTYICSLETPQAIFYQVYQNVCKYQNVCMFCMGGEGVAPN